MPLSTPCGTSTKCAGEGGTELPLPGRRFSGVSSHSPLRARKLLPLRFSSGGRRWSGLLRTGLRSSTRFEGDSASRASNEDGIARLVERAGMRSSVSVGRVCGGARVFPASGRYALEDAERARPAAARAES